jgi:D-alanyl-D-alanine carboxypeptidase
VNALSSRQRRASTRAKASKRPRRGAALRPYRGTTIAGDFREVWHSDYSQHAEFRIYSADGVRDSIPGGLQMGARISRSYWLALAGLVATLTIAAASCDPAQARVKSKRDHSRPRAIHGPSYHPPYADIVVDDKSGLVLHEVNADEPRHPASLTKIMTLYLLFEQLEGGNLKLDTPLPVSTRAALQNPTKLGLKPNQTINVEDAIKGLVTKSANDAAVVVAEAIGGSEEDFAKLMTLKAAALGMTGTTYVNASGLPAEAQITTARDQAVLGRAVQHRFPLYYQYFATPSFRYKGAEMRNHNHLLGQVKGVDGIKTGYTEASGYNLTSSVRRDEKHIVAVVLGGTSNGARDARMRQLIEAHILQASTQRTAPILVEANGQDSAHQDGAHQDNARQDGANVVAVAPATPNAEPPAAERADAAVASAKADPVPVPRPRLQAAKLPASASKQAASAQAPATRAPRTTAKASTLGVLQDISALRQTRHVERNVGSSAPLH